MSVKQQHIAQIERTGTTEGVSVLGRPVVLLRITRRGDGERAVPVMRVEHDGVWLAVASKGGAPEDPAWRADLQENPELTVQDGETVYEVRARELTGEERTVLWDRAVAAFPQYADYQMHTERTIPLYALEAR